MNKQAIETEYKRICDKLGFITKLRSIYENFKRSFSFGN